MDKNSDGPSKSSSICSNESPDEEDNTKNSNTTGSQFIQAMEENTGLVNAL